MDPREQRGLLIAATARITRKGGRWTVPSPKERVHPLRRVDSWLGLGPRRCGRAGDPVGPKRPRRWVGARRSGLLELGSSSWKSPLPGGSGHVALAAAGSIEVVVAEASLSTFSR